MKQRSTSIKILLTLLFLITVTSLKAQTVPDITAPTAVYCQGAQVKIGATAGAVAATSYIWQRYDGKNTSTTPNTITGANTATLTDVVPSTPGYYTYVSIGVNGSDCESTPSAPVTIYVLPGITASIASSYPTEICATKLPATGTLTATAGQASPAGPVIFAGTDYSYQWYKGTDPIPGAQSSTYTLTAADIATAGTTADYSVKINYASHPCTEVQSNAINFNLIALPSQPTIAIQ